MTTPPVVRAEYIPAELQALDQFVTWKWPAPSKKLPCNVTTGEVDDPTNLAICGSFEAAYAAYRARKHAGIGFVLTEYDPYVGIDLDDCVEDGKIIHPDARAIVALSDWWDISPSGTGLKTIVRGHVPSSATGKTPGGLKVEIYPAKRFFTLTGQSFEGRPAAIGAVNGELTRLYEQLKPQAKTKTEAPRPRPLATVDTDHARRYALAALESEHQAMLAAGEGERHNTRRKAAYSLAGYIPHITDQEIFDALAVNFGADRRGAEKTIWDCIKAGQEEPRDVPEPEQPTWDAEGHACCPTHLKRLIPCRNGNGWRCPVLGASLCLWWRGDGYTPPAEVCADDLDTLDPDTLRRRLREAIAERDRWKERAVQLEMALGQVKEHNRFVTQATGAEGIHTPSMRLTFIELKKELDRVPVEERAPGQFVRVRPSYMAKCSNQNASNISRHLAEFEKAGLIEKDVRRTPDPNDPTKWYSETFVRPLVDLSDPTKVVIAAKPRGLQACKKCGSEKIMRQVRTFCPACDHEEWSEPEPVNPPEMQNAIQSEDAGDIEQAEILSADDDGLNCILQDRAPHSCTTPVTCADAIQNEPNDATDNVVFSTAPTDPADYQRSHRAPPLLFDDPAMLPGVQKGYIAPDDEWFTYNRAIQRPAAAEVQP